MNAKRQLIARLAVVLCLAMPLALAQAAGTAAAKTAGKPGRKPTQGTAQQPAVPAAAAAPASSATSPAIGQTAAASAPSPGRGGKALDRIDLDATQITGNKELPKVMYVVPWKRPDLGDYAGRPPNSLLDEILQPVDRDVFKRQNRYYSALQPDMSKDAGGAAATPRGDGAAPAGNAGDNGAAAAPAPPANGVEK